MEQAEAQALAVKADPLIAEASSEVSSWVTLRKRGDHVMDRLARLNSGLHEASAAVQGLAMPANDAPGANMERQLDALRSALQVEGEKLRAVAQRVDDLSAPLLAGGDLREGFDRLGSVSETLAAAVESQTDMIEAVADAALSDLTEGLVERARMAEESVQESLETLARGAEEEMQETIEETAGEAFEKLKALSEECSEEVEQAGEAFKERVGEIVEELGERLEARVREWTGELGELGESYAALRSDLEELGRQLNTIYGLTIQAMEGSGVGMNAAASSLNDLKSIMGDVV